MKYDTEERAIEDLNFGYAVYDNFILSLFTSFHLINMTSWSNICYAYWKHHNTFIVGFYFVSFLVIGGYIVMNLFLGSLYEGFNGCYSDLLNRKQIKALYSIENEYDQDQDKDKNETPEEMLKIKDLQ
jgi:hypothetical protein